jgi:hypothetical protein
MGEAGWWHRSRSRATNRAMAGSVWEGKDGRFGAEYPVPIPGGTKTLSTTKTTREAAEAWAEGRLEKLRAMYLDLLVEMAGLYEGRREWRPAIEALTRAVSEEPVLEEAHVGLMRLYAFSRRSGHALLQYERLRETLQRELGAEPDASVRALREEIASGRFPPQEVQPLGSRSREAEEPPQHNLPVPRTGFVDRQHELTEIKPTIAMTRLLTLTGVGGSGKTRLALKVATDLASTYPDGAWFAELVALSEPDLVPQAVADATGAREQPGRPIAETVTEHLGEKRGLLVLDNCEHPVDAAARLAEEAEPELKRQRQEEWLKRLEAEHDNFRAALSWSLEQGEAELGLQLGTALIEFWHLHVHHNEARRWLGGALAKEGASPSARKQALERLLPGMGARRLRASHYVRRGRSYASQTLRGHRERGGHPRQPGFGSDVPDGGRPAPALLEEAVAMYRVSGDE